MSDTHILDNEPIIQLESLSYSYRGTNKPVLNNLRFEFYTGEKVAILGPNGSGKTTLFHLIMGLLLPDEGSIKIFGKLMKNKNDYKEIRKRIGYLFQDSDDQLFSPTVIEDVAFGPLNLGIPKDEVRKIVSETLKSLGLEGYEYRITYKLSGGEKRLVALATVLAMRPDILLLDEPVLGLDDEHKERFIKVLNRFRGSYIIISHDRDFLKKVVNKSYKMKNGKLTVNSNL